MVETYKIYVFVQNAKAEFVSNI